MSPRRTSLSVLDLVPVRTDQTTGDALAATVALARVADELGYRRYWLAEHHNMPAVAATNPPVLIAMVAGATERIRVGSGGVMLPNHAPLVVAEQFALLEAALPGRIDLGIGRAPGTDPVTSFALRHGAGGVERRGRHPLPGVRRQRARDDGRRRRGPDTWPGSCTSCGPPRAPSSVPAIWLLGSSDYSARLAAEKGMPYVFAHHFSGAGPPRRWSSTARSFRPSPELAEPRTFLTVNAVVAQTRDEAHRLALPAAAGDGGAAHRGAADPAAPGRGGREGRRCPTRIATCCHAMRPRWVIDDPGERRDRIDELAATYGVDEVMVHPVAGAFKGTDPAQPRARGDPAAAGRLSRWRRARALRQPSAPQSPRLFGPPSHARASRPLIRVSRRRVH